MTKKTTPNKPKKLRSYNNTQPFIIPGIIAKKSTKYTVYQGPVNLVTGILTFNLFYSIYIILFALFTKNSYPFPFFLLSLNSPLYTSPSP